MIKICAIWCGVIFVAFVLCAIECYLSYTSSKTERDNILNKQNEEVKHET